MLLKIFLLTKLQEVKPPIILKQSGFIYVMLRDCINDCLLKGSIPDSLKLGNIAPVY